MHVIEFICLFVCVFYWGGGGAFIHSLQQCWLGYSNGIGYVFVFVYEIQTTVFVQSNLTRWPGVDTFVQYP